jgi:hypothetical protein
MAFREFGALTSPVFGDVVELSDPEEAVLDDRVVELDDGD